MSETKVRTSQQVHSESVNLQLKAGGIQYTVEQYQKELKMINEQMRDLAIEFHALKAKEDQEAALRKEIEAQVKAAATPKLEVAPAAQDQNPTSEVNQATTQPGSDAVPTQSPVSPDEQSQKKE